MCRSEQEREFVRITKEECVCITENLFLLAVSVEIDTKWSVLQQQPKFTKLSEVYLPAVDYIKQQILDNKAAQTEIQGHCYIEQTEVYKCHFHSLRTTLTD